MNPAEELLWQLLGTVVYHDGYEHTLTDYESYHVHRLTPEQEELVLRISREPAPAPR